MIHPNHAAAKNKKWRKENVQLLEKGLKRAVDVGILVNSLPAVNEIRVYKAGHSDEEVRSMKIPRLALLHCAPPRLSD